MAKKSVSEKSDTNRESGSMEWDFWHIEDALRKLVFIQKGFSNIDDRDEDLIADMFEGMLPGIVTNLEAGFKGIKEKVSENTL